MFFFSCVCVVIYLNVVKVYYVFLIYSSRFILTVPLSDVYYIHYYEYILMYR